MSSEEDSSHFSDSIGERVARRTSTVSLMFRRLAGAWIDFIVVVVVFFIPWALFGPKGLLPLSQTAFVRIGFAFAILYFPLSEGFLGRTVGKLITGTVVVNRAGRTAGVLPAAIRTVTRLIEVNPFLLGGIPAGLVALNTKANQRIGDLLANTYVVPTKELRAALATPHF